MAKLKPLPCRSQNCRNKRPAWRFLCETCWQRVPGWLRVQIAREKEACRAAGVQHTQRLLELRDLALKELAKTRKDGDESPAHV